MEHKIWDGRAQINLSDSFKIATVGEKRKMYGMRKELPKFMMVDRENHVVINAVTVEQKEQKELSIEKEAQALNYMYTRTVPGYKCRGIYKKVIDQHEVCVIQYTSYTIEDTLFTMVLLQKEGENVNLLQCICKNGQVPEWHPVFRDIVEKIQFKKEEASA
ncbi:hypothetical protein [Roseburia sp. 831b]|uniref:hypothetical protein n=1 Tax=Roseburia sp. 831b TaxID=1261635 RepID=UPI000950E0DA|nr:hypothetical protein [Roseburia sp. 831b]WVK73205.1 hypothetical protein BIV16_01410 [Roseburia sp. 831b]